jgi:hypothetical protein
MATPSALILEMHPAVSELQARVWQDMGIACSEENAAYYTDKLIEDIVTCLDRESMAMSSLYDYSAQQKRHLQEEGLDAEATRMGKQIMDFGCDLLNSFQQHHVYENGELHYVFTGRCTTKTLILSRYN